MSNSVDQGPLLLCPGEPAGAGPDLALTVASRTDLEISFVAIGDPQMLAERRDRLGLQTEIAVLSDPRDYTRQPGCLQVLPVATDSPVHVGVLDPRNAAYVLRCLDLAIELCTSARAAGVVTGPLHKGVINESGVAFTGHTEYLAEAVHCPKPVMMLATPGLRITLVTTHLPLARVPAAITAENIEAVLEVLHHDMRRWFGVANPRIFVTGLNPHAGEGGYLGREEIDEIIPALERCRSRGMDLTGPLPADTAFIRRNIEQADVFLAMYHDQGLPVLKYAGFGQAVNVTLGLPFIRTSVDHGVALDLAGSGRAEAGSLIYALQVAAQMAEHGR